MNPSLDDPKIGHVSSADDDTSSQRKQLQAAANQSSGVMQMRRLQAAANNSPQVQSALQRQAQINASPAVIQRNPLYKHGNKDYSTETVSLGANQIAPDTNSKNIQKKVDTGLPTARKVLIDTFGQENINLKAFPWDKDYLDRPHQVSADMTAKKVEERFDPETSKIGNNGTHEFWLRSGKHIQTLYHGGHLLGAKILGNEAAEAYNIAPQEGTANRKHYNNTIEEVIRSQKHGLKYKYTVSLNYSQNNFTIDQATLFQRGVLKKLMKDKPWTVVIPTRIPNQWTAEAKMAGKATWGYTGNNTGSKKDALKSREAVDGAKLNGARESDRSAFTYNGEGTKILNFYMRQMTPTDTTPKNKPKGYDKAYSLANPDQYEKPSPKPKDMAYKISKVSQPLWKMASDYKKEAKKFPGYEIYKNDPATSPFNAVNSMPVNEAKKHRLIISKFIEIVKREGKRKNNSQKEKNKTPKVVNKHIGVLNQLQRLDAEQVFGHLYRKKKNNFDSKVASSKRGIEEARAPIDLVIDDLNEIGKFFSKIDLKKDLSKKKESELKVLYKQTLKYEDRLKMIAAQPVKDLFTEIGILGTSLQHLEQTNQSTRFQDELNKEFKSEMLKIYNSIIPAVRINKKILEMNKVIHDNLGVVKSKRLSNRKRRKIVKYPS